MKISVTIASAAVSISNDEGEVVYAVNVENYSMSTTPEKLIAAIVDCAQDVVAAYEDAQSKLAASL